jgi:predicted DNA-binding antitoxin AbrB/MazE fold protein
MVKVLEVVYEDGVLKPLTDPGLADHQRVLIEIQLPDETAAESGLAAWQSVYDGLSDDEVADVEAIVLDRSHFFRQQP